MTFAVARYVESATHDIKIANNHSEQHAAFNNFDEVGSRKFFPKDRKDIFGEIGKTVRGPQVVRGRHVVPLNSICLIAKAYDKKTEAAARGAL